MENIYNDDVHDAQELMMLKDGGLGTGQHAV